MRERGAALVHANMAVTLPLVIPAARRLGIPVLTHLHTPYVSLRERHGALVRQSTLAVGVAEHVVAPLRAGMFTAARVARGGQRRECRAARRRRRTRPARHARHRALGVRRQRRRLAHRAEGAAHGRARRGATRGSAASTCTSCSAATARTTRRCEHLPTSLGIAAGGALPRHASRRRRHPPRCDRRPRLELARGGAAAERPRGAVAGRARRRVRHSGTPRSDAAAAPAAHCFRSTTPNRSRGNWPSSRVRRSVGARWPPRDMRMRAPAYDMRRYVRAFEALYGELLSGAARARSPIAERHTPPAGWSAVLSAS